MSFTAKDVAALREQTGAGMMDCKKALVETNGDMEKAAEYLRKQGINIAAKKAGRIASEGMVASSVSKDGKAGALVEINCESDFVAKSEPFVALCEEVAGVVLEQNPTNVEALLALKAGSETVEELINNATAKIGEKLSLRRFVRQEVKEGRNESYIHMLGKIGVLVEFETGKDLNKDKAFVEVAHDVAMHIAAMNPSAVSEKDIPAEVYEKEKEIQLELMKKDPKNEGKPEQILIKMIEGKMKKFAKEICLLEQEFFKDPSMSVGAYVQSYAKKVGAEIQVMRFTRFEKGEGLEKKTDNLAEEVAKMSK
ncbi:MAG: translation elongation factor Ts [Firmicutes bacterium]|nr:translation elongation factor Ts [Bacillota bacterium]